MEPEFNKAKEIYNEGEYSCVLVTANKQLKINRRGIEPLLRAAESGEYKGCCAADKIVGKAAALLYVYTGAKAVYANVISNAAIEVFNRHGVYCEYALTAQYIVNRTGDGVCPMEQAVANINEPSEAVKALNIKLAELK